MRKSLLLVAPPVLLALGYAAWPAWSAWQLRAAVKARDIQGIERRVDWPQLRANLKRTIAANLQDDTKSPDAGFFGKAVKRTLGPLVANRVIDAAVTPRTLARVLAGRLDAVEMARDATVGSEGAGDAEASNDPLSPRRLRWAFFEIAGPLPHRGRRPHGAGQARGQHLRAARRELEARGRVLPHVDLRRLYLGSEIIAETASPRLVAVSGTRASRPTTAAATTRNGPIPDGLLCARRLRL